MTKPLLTVIGQPGLHHNFLRYIIDRTSGLSPDIEQLPFMNTGTSHSMDVKYSDLFKVIQSRPVDSSDHGPFVCMDGDDILYWHRASLSRVDDKDVDLRNYENFANWQKWNNHHVEKIKSDYKISEIDVIPKFILRDSFKKGFLDLKKNGLYLENIEKIDSCKNGSGSTKTYLFPVTAFFSEQSFLKQLADLSKAFDLKMDLSNMPAVYKMFYENNKILQTHTLPHKVLNAVKDHKYTNIPKLDIIQEAYIYAILEKETDFINMPLVDNFFENTGEIINYIKYFPEHYKAMNPNLPTFNGIPNPYYLAKLKK